MKLTKQIKEDLKKAYQCAMEVSILDMKAPLRYINQYVAENVSGYGTAADEKVQSREDYRKMVMAGRQQSKGMLINGNIITPYRPKFIDDTTAQFRDEIVVQIGDKKNKHSLHLWFSTLFKYQHNKWQLVMFHGSMPDAASSIEDTFHVGEAEKKLKELEQVVAQRTADLLTKTRELEIETSLEKVRAIAMGMKRPDDMLEVCKTISLQLQLLGVKEIRNVQTAIFYKESGSYMNYEYYAKHRKAIVTETSYTNHNLHKAFAKKMMQGKGEFYITHIKGKKVKEWIAYQKTTNVFIDKFLNKASSLNYYWHSLGPVALGISTYAPLSKADQELFNRFLNVFELSYRRYLDIEQAEAQAREVEIELSLERVRSAAMAMKQSDEIGNLIHHLYKELTKLDARLDRCFIMIVNPENKGLTWWLAGKEGLLDKNGFFIQYNEHPSHLLYLNHWKKRQKKWHYLFEGKEKKDWDRFGFSKTELSKLPEPVKKDMAGVKKIFLSGSSDSFGCLVTGSIEPLSEQHQDIISRFASVFNQTYTRFLDLQKAEAQTREAQIEAALERVRSRSMAMHRTSELQEVINTVHQELVKLNIGIHGGSFITINSDLDKEFLCWGSGGTADYSEEVKIPHFDNPLFTRILIKIKKGPGFFTEAYTQAEKKDFFKQLFKHDPWSKLDAKNKKVVLSTPGGYTRSCSVSKHTSIFIVNHFGEKFSDAENEMLKRFGKVFEQSYTRFLDLQTAEAQAREAHIEAALERIRARALAMHQSEEFTDVAKVMREQMGLLGQKELETSAVHLYNEDADNIFSWRAFRLSSKLKGNISYGFFKIPKTSCAIAKEFVQHFKSRATGYTIEVSGTKQTEWYKILFKLAPEVAEAMKKSGATKEKRYYHFSKFSGGALLMVSSREPAGDAVELQKRSAQVFDLAYRRFKDLQKAEAQAREAQIEAALERVRSRSMAMHKSDELLEAGEILFLEMQKLGIESLTAGYVLFDKELKNGLNYTPNPLTKKILPLPVIIPHNETSHMQLVVENWKAGNPFFIVEMDEAETIKHQTFIAGRSTNFPLNAEQLIAISPKKLFLHNFYFKEGYLLIVGGNRLSEEQTDIMLRFAKVFQQTYTRFLDLQKAEAQAREAEIELGLERVRARAMAMQKSDELSDLVDTVFKELTKLDFALNWCIINIIDEPSLTNMVWAANPETNKPPESYLMKFEDFPFHHSMLKGYQERKAKHVYVLEGKEKKTYDDYLFNKTEWRRVPKAAQDASRAMKRYVATFAFSNFGGLQTVGEEYLSEKNLDILSRFGKVFDLTYTRFNDLQKAEAQAREAQIEAALERVRSRSMAMQKSEDLGEVILLLLKTLPDLGISMKNRATGIFTYEEGNKDYYQWAASPEYNSIISFHTPYIDHPVQNDIWNARRNGTDFYAKSYTVQEKNSLFKFFFELPALKNMPLKDKKRALGFKYYDIAIAFEQNSAIVVVSHSGIPLTEDENEILKRFSKVFEQTYTRFLDLQKAEAQAREAKIEAALERTRTQSMLMQHSAQLDDTLRVFHEQVLLLGIPSAFSFLWLPDEKNDRHIFWAAWKENNSFKSKAINYPLDRNEPATAQCLVDWKGKELVVSYHVPPAGVEGYFAAWKELLDGVEKLKPKYFRNGLYYVESFIKYGCFGVMVESELAEDEKKILRRFATEFERTYTRFLDLKNAEAQAREAEIELALERVRARTMAMQKSDELKEVIQTVYDQFLQLKINIEHTGFILDYKERDDMFIWLADLHKVPAQVTLPYFDCAHWNSFNKAKAAGEKFFANHLSFKEKNKFYTDLFKLIPGVPQETEDYYFKAAGLAISTVLLDNVCLYIENFEGIPYTDEENDILMRFGKVFQQTYTRFLDLQKAEAQVRESEIELALERVRARTMAMQHSDELAEASFLLDSQVRALGIKTRGCAFNIYGENESTEWFSSEMGTMPVYKTPREDVFLTYYEEGQKGMEMYIDSFEGDACAAHYDYLCTLPVMGEALKKMIESGGSFPTKQIDHITYFKYGYLLFITLEPVPEAHEIFKRFAKVFEQTYTRFLDLQKAEAQTREAQIETALEKVRSRTMAMQSSNELQETATVLFNEFKKLGTEDIYQVTIGIYNEDEGLIDFRVTSWAGSGAQENRSFKLDMNEPTVLQPSVQAWKANKKSLVIDLTGETLEGWLNYRNKMSGITVSSIDTAGRRVITVAYYSKGHLSISTPVPVPTDTLRTLERFAAVFDSTYTRFLDLEKAEAQALRAEHDLISIKEAKQKAEEALTELQLTQKQLIQSEKMASLGELTAGIAHEIQNPLNFVNNFSEVSNELLDEMLEAAGKGDFEEVKEILNDVKQNLEKINHHGKRADGIVKGMLQHSRSSSGVKEPMDINALADEYLRLAYHGLRAKDKSFNATMKTEYEEGLEKVNVIPQDMGRVILNLITNAFYVVNEKKKQQPEGFEPTVTVSTNRISDKIQISVKDNGNGIPPKVLDKIFQPFFTTKPTGQGTGLGLSLAFDIVRSHGGELKVETIENEGTLFLVILPL